MVQAHATWIGATPPQGANLATPPEAVQLVFNEPVSPLRLQWLLPDGSLQAAAGVRSEGSTLQVPMPAHALTHAQAGNHALAWRVVSADGHPIGGTLAFSVGAPGPATSPPPQAKLSPWLANGLWLSRWVLYVGLFFGFASTLYRVSRSPRPPSPWPPRLAAVGLAAAVLGLGLHGLDLLGLPAGALLTASPWLAAASSHLGLTTLLVGLALAFGCWAGRHAPPPYLTYAVLALAALGLALSGHASVAPPQWLSRPAVWAHAIGVAAWLGVLIPLAAGAQAPPASVLGRFSRLAPAIVALVILSGSTLALRQLDHPASLLTTDYGRLLLLKLALVVALLGCALVNRRLTPAALKGDPAARNSLRRMVRLEILLALIILGVAAGWRLTPPPRAIASAAPAATSTTLELRSHEANASLLLYQAASSGHGQLAVALFTPQGQPLTAREVTVSFDQPAAGIEPLTYGTTHGPGGLWRNDVLLLPPRDHWRVRITVLVSDFDRFELATEWDTHATRHGF